jgi:hypothetical protein
MGQSFLEALVKILAIGVQSVQRKAIRIEPLFGKACGYDLERR